MKDEPKVANVADLRIAVYHTLDMKDVTTPEELLEVFQTMGTNFSILEGSEAWYAIAEAGLGHLLTPQGN